MNASLVASIMVFFILVLATVISKAISLFYSSPELDKVWLRIKSWWFIALLPLVCLYFGPLAVTTLFALVTLVALSEFFKLVEPSLKKRRELILISVPLVLFTALFSFGMWHLTLNLKMAFVGIVLLSWTGLIKSKYKVFFGMVFLVSALSAVSVTSQIHDSGLIKDPFDAVFYLLFLTSLNDVFQYLFGKTFGKSKLAPTISPSKTWAGLWGGMFSSGLLSMLIAPFFLTVSSISAFIIGISLSIAGTLGDLTISRFKRSAQVADTGSLLPGHGGILYRIDSLCLTAPTFYFFIQTFIPALNLIKELK